MISIPPAVGRLLVETVPARSRSRPLPRIDRWEFVIRRIGRRELEQIETILLDERADEHDCHGIAIQLVTDPKNSSQDLHRILQLLPLVPVATSMCSNRMTGLQWWRLSSR